MGHAAAFALTPLSHVETIAGIRTRIVDLVSNVGWAFAREPSTSGMPKSGNDMKLRLFIKYILSVPNEFRPTKLSLQIEFSSSMILNSIVYRDR
jgi:hypothetical protein